MCIKIVRFYATKKYIILICMKHIKLQIEDLFHVCLKMNEQKNRNIELSMNYK